MNVTLLLHCSVFFGSRPVYDITDMDLFREITVKHFDKFTDRMVSHNCGSTLFKRAANVQKCKILYQGKIFSYPSLCIMYFVYGLLLSLTESAQLAGNSC